MTENSTISLILRILFIPLFLILYGILLYWIGDFNKIVRFYKVEEIPEYVKINSGQRISTSGPLPFTTSLASIGAHADGFYLSIMPVFLPTVFIPWSSISWFEPARCGLINGKKLYIGSPPIGMISMTNEAFRTIKPFLKQR